LAVAVPPGAIERLPRFPGGFDKEKASMKKILNIPILITIILLLSVSSYGADQKPIRGTQVITGDLYVGGTIYNDALDVEQAARIATTITDGVTTSSPNQNAVFDALALKAPVAGPTFTGTAAFGVLTLPEKTPVNAVAASGVVTFTGQPLAYVANVNASGVITVNGTPVAEEQMTVGAQLFTFKAAGTALGNIVISATPAVQAANIVTSITRDLATVTAVAVDAVITVTAVAPGTAGNALAAVETATGIEWSSVTDNKLDGGVDEVLETLTIGTQAFKFVTLRGAVGSFEITSDANTTTQAANAKAAINADLTNVTADNTDAVLTVTAAVKGVSGNLIALSESATGTAVSSVTGGKLDGGIDGTAGVANETCVDASYLYHCIAVNGTDGTNWRKVDLGSAF